MNKQKIIAELTNINESTVCEQYEYRRNGMDFVFRKNNFYQEIINLTKKTTRFFTLMRKTPYRGKLVNDTFAWTNIKNR